MEKWKSIKMKEMVFIQIFNRIWGNFLDAILLIVTNFLYTKLQLGPK